MYCSATKYILLLACLLNVSWAQLADESVMEGSTYNENPDPNVMNKYDLSSYFTIMRVVETMNVENKVQVYAGREGLTPQTMLQNSIAPEDQLGNLTFQARVALRVGNKIINDLPNEEQVLVTVRALQAPLSQCPFVRISPCSSAEVYRRIDGTCTNLKFPHWGKANTPYKRFLAPIYENRFDSVQKRSITGFQLPNPRSVSIQVCADNSNFDLARTAINAAFGQFIDHDFTSIAGQTLAAPCTCESTDPECLIIPTPPEDTLNRDQKCMTQTRSAPSFTNENCGMGHREQMNTLTAAIDLSHIYGNDEKTQANLREFVGGRLRTSKKGVNGRELAPGFGSVICRDETPDTPCFLTADGRRANINMHLASLHILWIREHNRLARRLQALNPTWNDEKIYQEARRINAAQTQNIIYSEWLPIIVGWQNMAKYDLLPSGNGYYNGYDDNVNVGVFNEFTTAAYRLHTLVRTTSSQIHPSFPTKTLTLTDITFRAVNAYEGSGVDGLLIGATVDTIGKFDSSLTNGLQNRLFEVPGQNATIKRFDLAAMNINRGRDHGLSPYVDYREWCGLGRARQFADLVEIEPAQRDKLASIYKDVRNIELFVGGMSEKSLPGSIVGPTFSCMISRQFRDFKRGDRFFFENAAPKNPKPFTLRQLGELHKITLATIFCENVDGVTSIQPNAFLSNLVPGNGKISCSQIPKLDLSIF